MNSFDYLFWKDGKIFPVTFCNSSSVPNDCYGLFCVDPEFSEDNPKMRYGKITPNGWRAIPLELFPTDFRTTLLLLGI